MRNRFVLLLLLAIPLMSCTSLKTVPQNATLANVGTMAILPFTSNNATAGHTISDNVTRNLAASGVPVLGFRQVKELLDQQRLDLDVTGANFRELIGRLEGVDALVIGMAQQKIAEYWLPVYGANEYYISSCTVRVIDARNGDIILTLDVSAEAPYAFINNATPEKTAATIAAALVKALRTPGAPLPRN